MPNFQIQILILSLPPIGHLLFCINRYPCQLCSYVAKRKDHLQRHVEAMHEHKKRASLPGVHTR